MTARALITVAVLATAFGVSTVRGGDAFYLTSHAPADSIGTLSGSGNALVFDVDSILPVVSLDAAPLAQQRDTAGGFSWQTTLSSGYDTYVQTYALSLEDTTETISEIEMTLSTEGRTAGRARHHWLVRPRVTVGSERNRGRLEWAYAHKPDTRRTTLRIDGDLQGTWYNRQSDYYLTSDSIEGRLKARWTVAPEGRLAGELRGWGSALLYATPSELEANREDRNVAAYLKSGRESRRRWRLGLARLLLVLHLPLAPGPARGPAGLSRHHRDQPPQRRRRVRIRSQRLPRTVRSYLPPQRASPDR